MNSNEDFNLEPDDAAIVMHKDLSVEMYLPKVGDDEEISFEENQHIYIIMAIMMSLHDEDFRAVINNKLDFIFSQANTMAEEDCGCPPSACGGCHGCDQEIGNFPKIDDDHDVNGHLYRD